MTHPDQAQLDIGTLTDLLVEILANEPPDDAGHHPSMELHSAVGDRWADWEKQRRAVSSLLGDKLVEEAIQKRKKGTNSD